jgi:hypothetical protein
MFFFFLHFQSFDCLTSRWLKRSMKSRWFHKTLSFPLRFSVPLPYHFTLTSYNNKIIANYNSLLLCKYTNIIANNSLFLCSLP